MSGKSTVAVSAASQPAGSQTAGARAAVTASHKSASEVSARWAALDSRHERLVTASDAVLADLDRKSDRRVAS